MNASTITVAVALAFPGITTPALAHEWTNLFDGETLDGWAAVFGGSLDAWGVEDGEIPVVIPGRYGFSGKGHAPLQAGQLQQATTETLI